MSFVSNIADLPHIPFYHSIEQIGYGGTGIVFTALDERTGFVVAVKMLYKQAFANELVKNKFHEEANRYLYLNHPNIVKLKDFIITKDAYFLVMEYVEGKTLEEFINTVTGPIPEEVAKAILIEVLDAIAFAHQNQVVHLDLKPSNIMISDNNDIKVLDFGISTEEGSTLEKIMGSPLYMTPEQLTGGNIDARTDVYALGVTLHQMVTGALPYKGNIEREELFSLIKKEPLPRAKDIYPFVSDKTQRIIDKATAKRKEDRFQTCHEFIEQLLK